MKAFLIPNSINLLFLPVQVAVMAVLDFQQSVVVDNTEVVDRVETKKKRPFLSFFEVSADASVAKMPRMTPDITFMFYQTETSLISKVI